MITVIYNPNGHAAGRNLARKLKADLKVRMPNQKVSLLATQDAGHAEALAYKAAMATKKPLIFSSSGDGGYNEVINGLMRAKAQGAKPVAGLLPAGNANDHFRNMHRGEVVDSIIKDRVQQIDLLKLSTFEGHKLHGRYAHSYIGIGLTPKVGLELNKNKSKLNLITEMALTSKVLFTFKPVRILVNGTPHKYDSLIFTKVRKMSKYMTIPKKAIKDDMDGTFNVLEFKHGTKLRLLVSIIKASTTGYRKVRPVKSYQFRTIKDTLVQLDGEISHIEPGIDAAVGVEMSALRCIV